MFISNNILFNKKSYSEKRPSKIALIQKKRINNSFNINFGERLPSNIIKIAPLFKKNTQELKKYWNMLVSVFNRVPFKTKNENTEILSLACGPFREFKIINNFFGHEKNPFVTPKLQHKISILGVDSNPSFASQNVVIGDATNLSNLVGDKKFDVVTLRHPEIIPIIVKKPDFKIINENEFNFSLNELKNDYNDILVTDNESSEEFLNVAKPYFTNIWKAIINNSFNHLNDDGIMLSSTYTETEYLLLKDYLMQQ